MIKSQIKVDDEAVKQFNEEQKDWTATCRICGQKLTGTLSEIRAHGVTCHGK